jgi:hypothetical protein
LTLVSLPSRFGPASAHGLLALPQDQLHIAPLGHAILDRLLARQWFGELLQFPNDQSDIEQGWAEFAARLYLQEVFDVEAQESWEQEGRRLTAVVRPQIPLSLKVPWVLRMIEYRLGRPAFWELNQEFFQRHLFQQVRLSDYLELAEEILADEPPGDRLGEIVRPWLQGTSIPALTYSYQVFDGSPAVLFVDVTQQTSRLWDLQLDLSIRSRSASPDAMPRMEAVHLAEATRTFAFVLTDPDVEVELDPRWRVLCKRSRLTGLPER